MIVWYNVQCVVYMYACIVRYIVYACMWSMACSACGHMCFILPSAWNVLTQLSIRLVLPYLFPQASGQKVFPNCSTQPYNVSGLLVLHTDRFCFHYLLILYYLLLKLLSVSPVGDKPMSSCLPWSTSISHIRCPANVYGIRKFFLRRERCAQCTFSEMLSFLEVSSRFPEGISIEATIKIIQNISKWRRGLKQGTKSSNRTKKQDYGTEVNTVTRWGN